LEKKNIILNHLIIINDQPYGNEKPYNALRLAMQIQKDHKGHNVWIFLMADASGCAVSRQTTANGYYNIERMIKLSTNKGTRLLLCGSCLEARGLKDIQLVEKAEISTMAELTKQIAECYKVLTF